MQGSNTDLITIKKQLNILRHGDLAIINITPTADGGLDRKLVWNDDSNTKLVLLRMIDILQTTYHIPTPMALFEHQDRAKLIREVTEQAKRDIAQYQEKFDIAVTSSLTKYQMEECREDTDVKSAIDTAELSSQQSISKPHIGEYVTKEHINKTTQSLQSDLKEICTNRMVEFAKWYEKNAKEVDAMLSDNTALEAGFVVAEENEKSAVQTNEVEAFDEANALNAVIQKYVEENPGKSIVPAHAKATIDAIKNKEHLQSRTGDKGWASWLASSAKAVTGMTDYEGRLKNALEARLDDLIKANIGQSR